MRDSSMVRWWCGQFTEGRTNVHGEEVSDRPSLVTPELMESVRQGVFQNLHFTILELSQSRLVVSKLGEALKYQSEEKKNYLGYVNMLYHITYKHIQVIWYTLTLIYSFVGEVSSPCLLTVHALSLACIIKYVKQKRHSYFRSHITTQPHCTDPY